MHRRCFALDLRDEEVAIDEYERIHRRGAVWPEVLSDLRARGFVGLTIWRTGNRLFMIAETIPMADAPVYGDAMQSVLDRWQYLTSSLQQSLRAADSVPEWIEMHCVFDLREYLYT